MRERRPEKLRSTSWMGNRALEELWLEKFLQYSGSMTKLRRGQAFCKLSGMRLLLLKNVVVEQ